MQYRFLSIPSLILVMLFLSACVANEVKKNKNTNVGQTKAALSSNKKTKSKKRQTQRTSVDHEKKNNILVTNLATDNDAEKEVGANINSKIESKCSLTGQCIKLIQNKIIDLWEYRKSYPKYKTILVLDLSKEGYITTIRLKRGSGIRAFDDSVITAVRQAAPFTEITYLPEVDIAEFSSIELVFRR